MGKPPPPKVARAYRANCETIKWRECRVRWGRGWCDGRMRDRVFTVTEAEGRAHSKRIYGMEIPDTQWVGVMIYSDSYRLVPLSMVRQKETNP